MKAKVYSEKVYDNVLDWTHGMGYSATRIVVENIYGFDNIAITLSRECLTAISNWNCDNAKFLYEIDIPLRIVEEAVLFINARKRFEGLLEEVSKLILR